MPPQTSFPVLEAQIRDQRTMVGMRVHQTPDQVKAGWIEWAAHHGFPIRRRNGDLTTDLRYSDETIEAYVSDNCWTASCPNCNGGCPTWQENPEACCLDCGTVYKVKFPSAAEVKKATTALEARPARNRHWLPHTGEKAADLARENIAHGYHPSRPLAAQVDSPAPLIHLDPEQAARIVKLAGKKGAAELREMGFKV